MSLFSLLKKKKINYLHIGKTGGSQIKYILEQNKNKNYDFRVLHHSVKLLDLPLNEQYFFSIRSPVSRFRSAFYYRKNKGLPGVFQDWKVQEEKAFNLFPNSNDLAENLFKDNHLGYEATSAMLSIPHLSKQQCEWFEKKAFFDLNPPIHIIRQEHLRSDIEIFFKKIFPKYNYKLRITLNKDISRKNSYPNNEPELSKLAINNLEKWYSNDIYFYKLCEKWIENNS